MPTYIYAITAADHPINLEGLGGVGDPSGELRTVGTKALSAVVSDAPEGLRAKRRDLVAHQSVLERLLADGAALPMRFGLVGPDDSQVVAALDEHREAYTERLTQIDGCVEYNLKVSRDEDDLLREVVADSAEVQRLNQRTRDNPQAQDDKVALGELIAREVQNREQRQAAELVETLAPHAVGHAQAEPTKTHFVNVSFLIRRDRTAAFSDLIDETAKRYGEAYQLSLHGPLPPYSFV
ncbi:GvpL/GvpF family gas vesicle protein [Streptomyces tsukubensis]|uniref:Gas vesicle protein n=1 Tax=Streptomyces tsukubensis TaxID=83656 RepID=A0A1V4A9W1_9ACTN|nr:GvpL/GvpF family gas vesicle protein [Streptomyces tsukubensis]OON79228.1 gas vesicle protein [Streptomyces tsukubensis]QFR94654.1 gas vesicle protein [Streptomyces tsukubensis]